jgi:succinate dehydrogenase / fumarate reductase cytochrome b subunit
MAKSSNKSIASSSIGKKMFMALTGLFLCLFLVGHLLGNLQLLLPDSKLAFNAYAHFMTTNPLVKFLSYATYLSVVIHALDGLFLTIANRRARPVGYYYKNNAANARWSSVNMGVLGTAMLAFIIVHMSNFWYKMHFGDIPLDDNGNKDLHEVVMVFFQSIVWVLLYVLSMVAIGFHLWHGFSSGFQSLGLSHPRYSVMIVRFGQVFSVVVPLLFSVVPLYIHFGLR